MITYNKYSKKKYDDVFKNGDLFIKSKNYNNDMFICLLTNIIITFLYLIIVAIISQRIYDDSLISKKHKTNNTSNFPKNNIKNAPIRYVPPYKIVNNRYNYQN